MPVVSSTEAASMQLQFGFEFADLYSRQGLARLDERFLAFLEEANPVWREKLSAARANPESLKELEKSTLLLALAPYVEDFLAQLFGIAAEVKVLASRHSVLAPLYAAKRNFVQRKAINKIRERPSRSPRFRRHSKPGSTARSPKSCTPTASKSG